MNPADFYLDVVYKPPVDQAFSGWREIFTESTLGKKMMSRVDQSMAVSHHATSDSDDNFPSAFRRFLIILQFYVKYFFVCPGYYVYRAVYLILCSVFIGTLFLKLDANTTELTKYSGSIFFNICHVCLLPSDRQG